MFLHTLSLREIQILDLVSREKTTSEIGKQLFISSDTVHSHRKNVLRKLKVRNAAGMVRKAFELGILKLY